MLIAKGVRHSRALVMNIQQNLVRPAAKHYVEVQDDAINSGTEQINPTMDEGLGVNYVN